MARASQRGAGATASRLVVGTDREALELEERIAAFDGAEAALLFGSGYLANVGVLSALVGRGDAVFSDRLNHASIIDGIRLSRAAIHRYEHGDAEHLDALLSAADRSGRRLIVTESVFSMDGDVAPLEAIVDLAERHGAALVVDEAHAGGVFGPGGRGLRPRARSRRARRSHDRDVRQGLRRLRRVRVAGARSGSTTSSTRAGRSSSRPACPRP